MMALTSGIRTASSRVVPLVLRASGGSQRYFRHHRSSVLLSAVSQPSRNTLQKSLFLSFLNHYSSKPHSDASLVRIIDTKLQCAVDWLKGIPTAEVLEKFPFEIEDHPEQHSITLRRVEGNDNDSDSDNEEMIRQVGIPMFVRVSKNEGPSLEFGVTAYLDHLEIDNLSIKHPESSEGISMDRYLDEDLQKAFRKYLKIRGIRNTTIHFLYCFMFTKDCRDHVACLKKLHKFFQA